MFSEFFRKRSVFMSFLVILVLVNSAIVGGFTEGKSKRGKQDTPRGGEVFIRQGVKYCKVQAPVGVKDKLAYIAWQNCVPPSKSFMVYHGKEMKSYDLIRNPKEVNGELTYEAEEAGNRFILYGDKEIGRKYDRAYSPKGINNKLAYRAEENGKRFIVMDGKEIGKGYDNVCNYTEAGESLAYEAEVNGKRFIVWKGEEIGKRYSSVKNPVAVGTSLAYIAEKTGKEFVVVHGRGKVGIEHEYISSLISVGGELAYIAGGTNKELVILNGRIEDKTSLPGSFCCLEEVDGELVYSIIRDGVEPQNRATHIVYKGEEIGKEYTATKCLMKVDNNLAYKAVKQVDGSNSNALSSLQRLEGISKGLGEKKQFILYGKKKSNGYSYTSCPVTIKGELFFTAKEGNSWYIVKSRSGAN